MNSLNSVAGVSEAAQDARLDELLAYLDRPLNFDALEDLDAYENLDDADETIDDLPNS